MFYNLGASTENLAENMLAIFRCFLLFKYTIRNFLVVEILTSFLLSMQSTFIIGGRTGLMVRASDSGSGDPGSILGRVGVFVSLSKRHLLPKSTGNTQE